MSGNSEVHAKNGKSLSRAEEMKRLVETKDWEGLDRLVGFSRDEDERILREDRMIDAAELNRQMEELDKFDDDLAARRTDQK